MEGIQEGIFSGGGILRSLSRKFRKTSSYDWKLIAIVAPGGFASMYSFCPVISLDSGAILISRVPARPSAIRQE